VTFFVSRPPKPGERAGPVENSKKKDDEMKRLSPYTAGILDTIKASLEKVPGIRCAFVYGAFAEREASPETGIDLIVIGGPDLGEMEEVISELEKNAGRSIRVYAFTVGEFREKLKLKNRFVENTLSAPKIMLIGNVNSL
jgi:predicted nucleotidyltransferase